MKHTNSLYVRTSLTIFIALFIFMVFSSIVVFQYIMQPIAKQSAGNLAALMMLSSQTWVELSDDARPRFEDELNIYHNLLITSTEKKLIPFKHDRAFSYFLKQALKERSEQDIELYYEATSEQIIWAKIPIAGYVLLIGFPYNHTGANPPKVFFILIIAAAVLIFLTSSFLVRRLTKPLEKLSRATLQMGHEKRVAPIEEIGAQELILLTRSFNQMNQRVQQLLDNRDTLLAGISHDLRTPIARIHLALELIKTTRDEELIDSIRNDLDEMNQLISQTLELARSKEKALDKLEIIDVNELLSSEVTKYQQSYAAIEYTALSTCNALVSKTTLQRILQNLIDNAIRYGDNLPIKITLDSSAQTITICIIDQGPGIPESLQEQILQPFFRLEGSRNSSTGGSGLGLAIVSQLCETYNWTLQIESTEDAGSAFCIEINR